MAEILVRVDSVAKKFCRSLHRSLWYGLQDLGGEIAGRRHPKFDSLRRDEFWALRDISFELKRGECLGILGRNGSGKTTLLRILNGLIRPDAGRIELRGAMGAVIALGAGFNPVLTGRENVLMSATLLGVTKREIANKMDEAIAFAELGEFIDMPVQHYSSGMSMRLGFSVAVAMNPDIVILDEVLAVGDAAFRFKCHRRIVELLEDAAVLFVSHDMAHVARIASRAMVLDHGLQRFIGDTPSGIEIYRQLNETNGPDEPGFVSLKAPITEFSARLETKQVISSEPLRVYLDIEATEEIHTIALRINVFNLAGGYAADCVVDSIHHDVYVNRGPNTWAVTVPTLPLKAGRYLMSFSLANQKGDFLAVSHQRDEILITGGHPGTVADCQLTVSSWIAIPQKTQPSATAPPRCP